MTPEEVKTLITALDNIAQTFDVPKETFIDVYNYIGSRLDFKSNSPKPLPDESFWEKPPTLIIDGVGMSFNYPKLIAVGKLRTGKTINVINSVHHNQVSQIKARKDLLSVIKRQLQDLVVTEYLDFDFDLSKLP